MVTYGAPQKRKKGQKGGNENRKGREGKKYAPRATGDTRADSERDDDDSGACPPRYSYRPNHNKYATGTDTCMPLAADRTGGERVVPSTQTRLTGGGRTEHANLHAPMFALVREKVTSQLELLRLGHIKEQRIECQDIEGGLRRFQNNEKENDLT
jgi:hypothetical protein